MSFDGKKIDFLGSMEKVRLSFFELESICSTFRQFFGPEDHLWLFGSRVRPEAKGGDIDLYVETQLSDATEINDKRLFFLSELYLQIGDQKIDLVINKVSDVLDLPIYRAALQEGVLLI